MIKSNNSLESRLENAIDEGVVSVSLLIEGFTSNSMSAKALAYQCTSDTLSRSKIVGLMPSLSYVFLQLEYLLACISQDCESDLVHDRGEACLELNVPLDPYWYDDNQTAIEMYIDRLGQFLRDSPEHISQVVTHFLEGMINEAAVVSALNRWKDDPKLQSYFRELHEILS